MYNMWGWKCSILGDFGAELKSQAFIIYLLSEVCGCLLEDSNLLLISFSFWDATDKQVSPANA